MDFGLTLFELRNGVIFYFIFLASLCVREYVRARTIDKLGDPNPAAQGLVTMHPLAHMDWIGTVFFPLFCIYYTKGAFVFGWGKGSFPNPSYFKNPRTGEVMTALAGPLANLGVALVASVVLGLSHRHFPMVEEIYEKVLFCNVVFLVLYLLPIPPRDGGVLLKNLVGMSEETFINISRWSFLFWLALVLIPQFSRFLTLVILIVCDWISVIYELLSR